MPNSKQIVYLSQAQYAELIANGSITVDGVTVTYDENDIYVTPQAEPVTDVRVNGTSITANGVANIPIGGNGSNTSLGVVKAENGLKGIVITNDGFVRLSAYSDEEVKTGTGLSKPLVPGRQHISTFYGLAKAAGHDEASSTEPLGTYTPEAQGAIQQMLGVSDLLAPRETSYLASQPYAVGDIFTLDGKLYKVTEAIAENGAIVVQDDGETVSGANAVQCRLGEETIKDVRINGVSVIVDGVAKIPKAASGVRGAVKLSSSYGIQGYGSGDNEVIGIIGASDTKIKQASDGYTCITPLNQHKSVFYGLAKAAGSDMRTATGETVGTYTDEAKAAIQHMLGTDTNLADYESDTTADAAYAIGELFMLNSKLHQATAAIAIGDTLEVGTNCAVVNAADVFPHDVQVAGTSIVSNGIANIPNASSAVKGVVQGSNGISISSGLIRTYYARDASVKAGIEQYEVIVPINQHKSVFYGLAKAAGDTTQSASSNAVGTYTESAKNAIHSMLGTTDLIEVGFVEEVTGTTPSITGKANYRYNCGEVSTLSITPPAAGSIDVFFQSGSTATVLTVPSTVKWPAWFDAENLEADTTYELLITDGTYGSVMTWAT